MSNKKVMVIGLDGATWDLMRPWAEKGILPTFKKLMETGIYGDLESTIPPFTIPAWTSFATGKNPGKIGYYDFLMPKKSLSDLKPITTKDVHGKTFYEILNENGKKSIIINLPGSYPPRIKEIVITSILTQGDNFIFPPDLVNEIPEFKNYRIIPDGSLQVNEKIIDHINDIRKLEKNRFECAKKLFRREWDFFFLLFSAPDWIQHSIYDKLVSGMFDENSDPVKAYKEIDGYIEWFMNNADDINILFMSDHGFTVYEKVFIVNNWLVKEGYLRVERGSKPELPRTIADKEIQKIKAERINIRVPNFLANHSTLIKLFLSPLYKKLKKVLPIEAQIAFQPVLSNTIAYSMSHSGSNFGGIYINDKERFIDGKVEISSYENIREEILDKLKQLEDPETGEKIILNYWKKEDVYSGPKLDIAPDIIFKLKDEYLVSLGYGINPYASKCIDKIGDIKSNHALQGIFLAYGPDIKKGVEIQNAKIYDLAPTILHIIGLPIPKDMDGRVLKEIFKEDSEPAKREIKCQEEVDEKELVKEKIKKLKGVGKI